MQRPTRPAAAWPDIPPAAAELMLGEVDRADEEMIGAILQEVPEFARPHSDCYTTAVRRAVNHAVRQFVRQVADPATPREETARLFQDEGRSLEPVQAALRLGARVAWRRLNETFGSGSLGTDVLARLGEAIFLYLDELAAACAVGFAQARAEVAGEAEPARRRLLDLVIADPPASPEAIADSPARRAGSSLAR